MVGDRAGDIPPSFHCECVSNIGRRRRMCGGGVILRAPTTNGIKYHVLALVNWITWHPAERKNNAAKMDAPISDGV